MYFYVTLQGSMPFQYYIDDACICTWQHKANTFSDEFAEVKGNISFFVLESIGAVIGSSLSGDDIYILLTKGYSTHIW